MTTALVRGKPVFFSVASKGPVAIEALTLNGAKIGIVYRNDLGAGKHSFTWNGATRDGNTLGNKTILLRLVTPSGSQTQRAVVSE